VYPHGGNWQDSFTVRRGYELNYKLISIPAARHEGTLAAEHSFVQISPDNVIVTALQVDNGALVLHIKPYEINTVKVRFA
jgi:alpha-mannosidase